MSAEQRKLYAILLVAVIGVVATYGVITVLVPNTPNLNPVPEVELTGHDGTSVNVTLSDLTQMSAITRNGSYQNSYGNVRGTGEYTGILVSDLVELVGGMLERDIVRIIASDGYTQTFDYSKVYPNASIWGIQGDMVLAYSYNDTLVPEYEDGYKLIFLPEDGYYDNSDANASTDPDPYSAGPQCVSNVVKIKVIREGVALRVDITGAIDNFTLTELKKLPSITGEGGYKRSTGTISGPHTIKGVSMLTMLHHVATLPENYTLIVRSDDGRITNFTKEMVEGTLSGYDPSGNPVEEIHSTMVLAYEIDGSPISEDGPLRIAFINEDGNLTDGPLWAKFVDKLTVTEIPVTVLMQETDNRQVMDESLVELQLCGQSKLFTYILVRRF